jgi:hypothetical protein
VRKGGGLRMLALPVAVASLFVLLIAGLFLAGLATGGLGTGPKTAAIVDQLSLTQPNPAFARRATELLEQGGYTVDYHPGERVTVDFYRSLPALDYDLVILRVHSGQLWLEGGVEGVTQEGYVSLFTGEPYSKTKYLDEQRDARVVKAVYYEGGDPIFAIASGFIETSMRGRFDDTLIVMMGCEGLGSERAARAFLDKGASAFASWDGEVSATHTDAATERLLEKLLLAGLTADDAVRETMDEVGPDPAFGAELRVLAADR